MTDKEQKVIFSRNLNALLNKCNKTQREVAESIGVSPQTFNTWCQAVALPRMGKVQRLADYFHVPKSLLIDPPSEAVSSSALSPDQAELLADYNKLNFEGKERARGQVKDLTKIQDYTQDTAFSEKKQA